MTPWRGGQHRFWVKRALRLLAITALFGTFIPNGQSFANHGSLKLEVSPEVTDNQAAGSTKTLTATLSSSAPSGGIDISWEIVSGPGDADGNSPESPDKTCQITASASSCTRDFQSDFQGTQLIMVWIDHDKTSEAGGGYTEADREEGRWAGVYAGGDCTVNDGTNCVSTSAAQPGSVAEPDITDVVQITWTGCVVGVSCPSPAPPPTLDCNPESQVNPTTDTGADATFVCTLKNVNGTPTAGVKIDAENMDGANDPDDSAAASTPDYGNFCTTDANGGCSASITPAERQSGAADICFWADDDNDNVFDPAGTEADGGNCDSEAVDAPEKDNKTDKVKQTWQTRSANKGGLDVQPELSTANTQAEVTITATVYDQLGAALKGNNLVRFEYFEDSPSDSDGNDPGSPDTTCNTNGQDNCSITISSADTGTDLICAWSSSSTPAVAGDSTNGTCNGEPRQDSSADDGVPQPADDSVDVVSVTWQEPQGYWILELNAGVHARGDAEFFGSAAGAVSSGATDMDSTSTGNGYWIVEINGGVHARGDAEFFGGAFGVAPSGARAISGAPGNCGYWIVESNGGVHARGCAGFFGSAFGSTASAVVGIESTPSGNGYWIFESNGGVHARGDAGFFGAAPGAVKADNTSTGGGYWIAETNGGVHARGDAGFFGSAFGVLSSSASGISGTPSDAGYWILEINGGVHARGNGRFLGSAFGATASPAVDIEGKFS